MSSASWTIISARSVSRAEIPWSLRYSLRFVSWVAIDLTLTTSSTPLDLMMPAMMRFASCLSRAQWTMPPRAVTLRSNSSSSSGSRDSTSNFTASAALRRSSQSGISSTRCPRFVRIVRVAWPRLRRICVFARVFFAPSGKVVPQRRVSSGMSTVVRHPPVWTSEEAESATAGIPMNVAVIVRSPGRFLGRRRCSRGTAGPWWRRGSRRGAWGGCPTGVATGRRPRA